MKRVITVLLAVLLALSLAACGSRVETKKLAGTWTCTIDVTDRMNAAAEQALGLSAADGTAQMPLQLVLTVTEDGAYTLRQRRRPHGVGCLCRGAAPGGGGERLCRRGGAGPLP